MEINPFDDIADTPSEDGLSRLSRLFARRSEIADKVEALKAELSVAEEELRGIDEKDFPDLFDEVGVTSFKIGNRSVSVEEKLYGGIPKDAEGRARAMDILKANGGESLMKMNVSIAFNKGEDQKAKETAEEIKDMGLNPVVEESIHSATYQKWARDMLEAGTVIDLKALGLYHRRFVKIK